MAPRDDRFLDDEYLEQRPSKGRKSGHKQPDLRHESQEDFGLTRKARSHSRDDDDFLEDFDEDDLIDDDDLEEDLDDDLDFDDDEEDFEDFEDDEDF